MCICKKYVCLIPFPMLFVTCTRSRKLGNVLYKVEELEHEVHHEGARSPTVNGKVKLQPFIKKSL